MTTISADPEFFIQDHSSIKSYIPFSKGTKEEPYKLEAGGLLHHDGVALEIAMPVCDSLKSFLRNMNLNLRFAKRTLPKGFDLRLISSYIFPKKELKDMDAHIIGCNKDYNAYTGEFNPQPVYDDSGLRTCGGHIHFSIEEKDMDTCFGDYIRRTYIKLLDCFLGIPSIILDTKEGSKKRRELYGKAGAYRPKAYGAEYRTLSNFWLESNDLMKFVYHGVESARIVCGAVLEVNMFRTIRDAQDIINYNEEMRAKVAIMNIMPYGTVEYRNVLKKLLKEKDNI